MYRIISRTVQVTGNNLKKCNRIAFFQQTKPFSEQPVEPSKNTEKLEGDKRLDGFAKALNDFEEIVNAPKQPKVVELVPFKKMLRNSKLFDVSVILSVHDWTKKKLEPSLIFSQLGDPLNKIVSGKIVNVVQDDLYIDFGWKFNCVCSKPNKNGQ